MATSYLKQNGLKKRCACKRKRWSECDHPWYFNFTHNGQHYRFNLNREVSRGHLSKTEAETHRDELQKQIRDGAFRQPKVEPVTTPVEPVGMTFGGLADIYLAAYANKATRSEKSRKGMTWYVRAIQKIEVPRPGGAKAALETLELTAIGKPELEAMRKAWTGRRPGTKGGTVAPNRMLSRLRHMFGWAIEEGHAEHHPFKRHGRTIVRLDPDVEESRERRLFPGEEQRLLDAASPHLKALIMAALDTGCRLGELLKLQWKDVHLDRDVLALPAANTKTKRYREVPITQRLRSVLDLRQHDPAGEQHRPEAFVFGTETGERAKSIRMAWTNTCRRAGVKGLRFHDLRRECCSRLLESGASLHVVRDWAGHANISTTSRYLAVSLAAMQKAVKGFEQHSERAGAQPPKARTPDAVHPTVQ